MSDTKNTKNMSQVETALYKALLNVARQKASKEITDDLLSLSDTQLSLLAIEKLNGKKNPTISNEVWELINKDDAQRLISKISNRFDLPDCIYETLDNHQRQVLTQELLDKYRRFEPRLAQGMDKEQWDELLVNQDTDLKLRILERHYPFDDLRSPLNMYSKPLRQ